MAGKLRRRVLLAALIIAVLLMCDAEAKKKRRKVKKEEGDNKPDKPGKPEGKGMRCVKEEDYFKENCPAPVDSYDGCCLRTQYFYYSCDCCKEVVERFGILGNCSAVRPKDKADKGYCLIHESFVHENGIK